MTKAVTLHEYQGSVQFKSNDFLSQHFLSGTRIAKTLTVKVKDPRDKKLNILVVIKLQARISDYGTPLNEIATIGAGSVL